MDFSSHSQELLFEFPPFLRQYKDGRVERLKGTDTVPPSTDPSTGVASKDPQTPLLVYYHGGGFVIESPFSPTYHAYLNSQVDQANVVAVSVDYRLAPEHPLPTAYEDSWAALQWVGSHSTRHGPEPWLNDHVDFNRVYLAGDSAGANIVHNMCMRAAKDGGVGGVKIAGSVMIHSFFWGSEPVGSEIKDQEGRAGIERAWKFVFPGSGGCNDPAINPAKDPNLSGLGCRRVLVCVAEKDVFRDRGRLYFEALGGCGWEGVVEFFESDDEGHVFHLFKPDCEKAKEFIKEVIMGNEAYAFAAGTSEEGDAFPSFNSAFKSNVPLNSREEALTWA
ncbi:hypothetical protein Syun_003872 [Stephania yunnanensis]|uniref:Alpha/beta hydrolase fold-3 domain-containing protein n=1 Tax=Stephania yunnanensis TaxID=152371 RepID=A0AAP0Q0Z0_9MAGN